MDMKVKEVAELVGVSNRTLHHYDQIGLLTPKEITDSSYWCYGVCQYSCRIFQI